jgi:deazaflavin-dependent oxidoreductase (nitroreductase family)
MENVEVTHTESYGRSSPVHRFVRWSAATRPIAKIYGVIQQPLDELVYRLSRGAYTLTSWLAGVEITMLTTTGAKSGKPRTVPVLGLPEGRNLILIASNFGRPQNPAWYKNLRAHPRATVVFNGVRREMVARELSGAERDRAFRRGEEIHPGFTRYRRWAGNRRIPVLSLEPVAESSN